MHVFLTGVPPYALAILGYLWHKHTVARQLAKHRKQTALIMNAVNANVANIARFTTTRGRDRDTEVLPVSSEADLW